MTTVETIGQVVQACRDRETATVAAAGMMRAGTVRDVAEGRIRNAYLYTNVGGARLEPIRYVTECADVTCGMGWATMTYCCCFDTPVYTAKP